VLHAQGDRALRLSFGHGVLVGGGAATWEKAASDELLLVCAGEEG
jgi:hypothetical protein